MSGIYLTTGNNDDEDAPMTAKPRLFTSPSAFPNPQRLRLFLHEKGIADRFEEHIYDMAPAASSVSGATSR